MSKVWNAGCNLSIAFLVSFICFYKCLRGVLLNPTLVPIQFAHTFPLLLLFYMLLCFLVREEGAQSEKRRVLLIDRPPYHQNTHGTPLAAGSYRQAIVRARAWRTFLVSLGRNYRVD